MSFVMAQKLFDLKRSQIPLSQAAELQSITFEQFVSLVLHFQNGVGNTEC